MTPVMDLELLFQTGADGVETDIQDKVTVFGQYRNRLSQQQAAMLFSEVPNRRISCSA